MEIIKFKTSLPPTLNHIRFRSGVKTPQSKLWIAECQCRCVMSLRSQGLECEDIHKGKFSVKVYLYLKRDRDIDSSFKLLLDALEGVVWENDKQVVEIYCRKYKSDNPRMLVEIKEI